MSERLLSLGLDVGTTSTQLVLSELTVENRASSFAVPEMEIAQRRILYKSPVHFTPLLEGNLVDGGKIRQLVEEEYQKAGINRSQVDTGAIIITGETSRRENARAVLTELSGFAGDFVVATAGPELESILAAKGAGAVDYSARTGKTLLHLDIGGGTTNMALIENGTITRTGCLNVGGRLIKFDGSQTITYVSPVLADLCPLRPGDRATEQNLHEVASILVSALEACNRVRESGPSIRENDLLLHQVWTKEAGLRGWPLDEKPEILSFSGGVAYCIQTEHPWTEFGDLGPILGQMIRHSSLCAGSFMLGEETIRATVIGAGCHATQLSGSTVFCQNVALPLKNLPVLPLPQQGNLSEFIREKQNTAEEHPIFSLPGIPSPTYAQVTDLAETIAKGAANGPLYLALEQDMAKALGHALAARLGNQAQILCIDRVKLSENSYLDVGQPVGPALPVIIKTLVLAKAGEKP